MTQSEMSNGSFFSTIQTTAPAMSPLQTFGIVPGDELRLQTDQSFEQMPLLSSVRSAVFAAEQAAPPAAWKLTLPHATSVPPGIKPRVKKQRQRKRRQQNTEREETNYALSIAVDLFSSTVGSNFYEYYLNQWSLCERASTWQVPFSLGDQTMRRVFERVLQAYECAFRPYPLNCERDRLIFTQTQGPCLVAHLIDTLCQKFRLCPTDQALVFKFLGEHFVRCKIELVQQMLSLNSFRLAKGQRFSDSGLICVLLSDLFCRLFQLSFEQIKFNFDLLTENGPWIVNASTCPG